MTPRRGLAERLRRPLWAVTFWYALFASLWISFSDALLGMLVRDPAVLMRLSVYKGLAFAAVTAVLLAFLMHRLIGRVVQREAEERQRHDTLVTGQQRILEGVAHGATLRTALEQIVQFIKSQVPEMPCSILLLDADGARVRHGAAVGIPPEYLDAIDGSAIGPFAGSCGTAAYTRRPVYVEDIETDPRWAEYKHLALPHGLRACWSTPIIDNQARLLGTFAMYYRRAALPSTEHLQVIEVATHLASIAISRSRAEQALRESETRFLAFMDAAPAIAWVTDDQGRHIYMNQAWSAAFGRDRESFVGHKADELVPESVAARIRETDAQVLATEAPIFIPEDRTEYNGEQRWWSTVKFPFRNADGNRLIGGVAIDITPRKQMEQELAGLRSHLEVVVDNLREGLIVTDPEASFVHWNPAALRILGYENPNLGRRELPQFAHLFEVATADGTLLPQERWPLARVRRGEVFDGYEVRVRRRSEAVVRHLSYSGAYATLDNGKRLAFVTVSDVSHRREQEAELRELNASLEARVEFRTQELSAALLRAESADRLKSAFLATMSHELRTPLNSIIGFTGILRQQLAGPLNEEQQRQLDMVRGSARHLLALINDVLDISKIEAGQLEISREKFELLPLLQRLVATMAPQVERKGLELCLDATVAPTHLYADCRRVEQVLLNLLSNAVKFTEQGRVTLRADVLGEYRRAPSDAVRSAVRFTVRDTGIGIANRDLGALFEPFRQLDSGLSRQHEGTGLGLSISRRLCDLMGGEIRVVSEPSVGSTFTVILPLHAEMVP